MVFYVQLFVNTRQRTADDNSQNSFSPSFNIPNTTTYSTALYHHPRKPLIASPSLMYRILAMLTTPESFDERDHDTVKMWNAEKVLGDEPLRATSDNVSFEDLVATQH